MANWSRGIDLRQLGSGNIGASNLWVSVSKWAALTVGFFDVVKGILVVWVAQLLGLGIAEQITVGVAAVAGHNWSVFLRFSGGRGLLTTMGIVLFLMPWGVVSFLAIASISFFTKDSPLPVLGGVITLPLVGWLSGEPLAITLGLTAMVIILVIRRLTAPRTPLTASVSGGQLFINRLLFDRDIRGRRAWVHRPPPSQSSYKEKG
ncbi:MAG: glycerol-3-phosphate acyltransferase [Dehalococcoidia bacterium]|nr:MAG: glycerol-3-phosphate acyltransferase [Dehalococcoidia bacterium]